MTVAVDEEHPKENGKDSRKRRTKNLYRRDARQKLKMDQQTAQVLFREGATFVFLDVPPSTEFGVDYDSWQTGPNFRGLKMIPPGVHFIYFSATNKEGETAPRTGFFHDFKARELVVRKWNPHTEDMTADGIKDEDLQRIAENMTELDRYLGPYPYDNYKKWVSMTNHISEAVLKLILPESGRITSVTEFESKMSTTQSRKQEVMETDQSLDPEASNDSESKYLPQMTVKQGTRIQYSCITKHRYPSGATPAEITRYSMDSSFLLEKIISENYSNNSLCILGEVQFAFICFLIGQNYDSFEQWKKLVNLLCTSEEALTVHVDLFLQLVTVLHFQIQDIPEDFFVDIVSQNNFLTSTLQEFFSNLQSNPVDEKLRKKGEKFCDHLTHKFKWDFTTEPDDYAPQVVETQ